MSIVFSVDEEPPWFQLPMHFDVLDNAPLCGQQLASSQEQVSSLTRDILAHSNLAKLRVSTASLFLHSSCKATRCTHTSKWCVAAQTGASSLSLSAFLFAPLQLPNRAWPQMTLLATISLGWLRLRRSLGGCTFSLTTRIKLEKLGSRHVFLSNYCHLFTTGLHLFFPVFTAKFVDPRLLTVMRLEEREQMNNWTIRPFSWVPWVQYRRQECCWEGSGAERLQRHKPTERDF